MEGFRIHCATNLSRNKNDAQLCSFSDREPVSVAELFFLIHLARYASMLRSTLFVGARRVGRNRRVRAFIFALAGCAFAAQALDLRHLRSPDRRELYQHVLA